MNSRNRNRIGLILALAAASCGLSPAIAQQRRQYDENPRFDVDFPGGTLSDYVGAVRSASPDGAVSIVVWPDALALHVPPIKLVGVTVVPAMQVLEGPYTTDDGLRAEVKVRAHYSSGSGTAIQVVADIKSRKVSSAVWSVEEALIYGQTAEKILEAVEAAFSLFPTKAEISYHPPTRLLIVRGTQEQRLLVREMLKPLIDGALRRRED
ncbi:MAG: hypothetical protein IID33_16365, partial [Planctomycetes bacterium]|nr:hypothetical protein [Planctomycetota bacterium]